VGGLWAWRRGGRVGGGGALGAEVEGPAGPGRVRRSEIIGPGLGAIALRVALL
jgi:hypothetical protein